MDALFREQRFDAVVHLAALVHVRKSELGFADYAKLNYYASEHLFERAAEAGVGRLAFASTVEVYGPKLDGAVVDEEASCQPDSDYGRSKLLAEESLRRIARVHGTSYCIMRFAPVYASDFRLNLDKRLYLKPPWLGYRLGNEDYRLSLCSVRGISRRGSSAGWAPRTRLPARSTWLTSERIRFASSWTSSGGTITCAPSWLYPCYPACLSWQLEKSCRRCVDATWECIRWQTFAS
ncbi:MAG: SDR family oxidoreductase [Polyangiaceae bacterium]